MASLYTAAAAAAVNAWTRGGSAPPGSLRASCGFFSSAADSGAEEGSPNFALWFEAQAAECRRAQPGSGQFRRLFPPSPLSLLPSARRVRIVNGRNKLISVQSKATAARLLSPHHGCKVLPVCRWEFYSRRTAQYGFCPLFGLLQLQ